MIPEPKPFNDRGFYDYAGGEFATAYGHTITVRESSAAMGPHVWLFIGDSSVVEGHDVHLNLAQAVRLRAALDQFIEGVPERWPGGAEMLAEAKAHVQEESGG